MIYRLFAASAFIALLAGCETQQQQPPQQQPPQPPQQTEPTQPQGQQSQQTEQSPQAQQRQQPEQARDSSTDSADSARESAAATAGHPSPTPSGDHAGTPSEPSAADGEPGAPATAVGGDKGTPTRSGSSPATPEETMGRLDDELNESLAVFDGMILTERANVQDVEDDYLEDLPDDGGRGGGLFEEGDLTQAGAGEGAAGGVEGDDDPIQAPMPGMPDGSGREDATTTASAAGSGRVPPDLRDDSDDDIVARQIREAAMNEDDPELREKLWEEYRKYKEQQQG